MEDLGDDPVARLEDLYRLGNARVKESEESLTKARAHLVKLQDGDPESLSRWEKIRELSMDSFDKIYRLLGVHFDHALGESFYRDKVGAVYEALTRHQICQEDDGALVVFIPNTNALPSSHSSSVNPTEQAIMQPLILPPSPIA